MAEFDWQGAINHPLTILGAGLMSGSDPRRTGLGGFGSAILNTGQTMRAQQQLAIENERARQLADLQMQNLQARMAQQGQQNLSKTPTYIRNPQTGKMEIIQLSATGAPVRTELPEGYEPALPMSFQDVGTHLLGFQRGAAAPTVAIEQGLSPEAQPTTRAAQTVAVEQAKATQAAQEQLPSEETQFARTSKYIDELIAHPGLEAGTGLSAAFPVIPGSDRADFEARKNQLLGGVFLQGFQMLKGGGPVTEVEGLKAEQAMARMDAATSKENFVEALEDYREALRDGLEKLRGRAGQQIPQTDIVDWSDL